MSAPVIVITGANGFIGDLAAGYYQHLGYKVVTVGRKPHRNGFDHIPFDLEAENPLQAALPEGAFALLHTAYLTAQQNSRAFELNVNGTRLLLDAATRAGIRQFLFLSSLSARPDAHSVYGRQKMVCEKLVLDAGGTVLRPGLVIGKGGLYASMRKHIEAGKRIPIFNGGKQPLQTVYFANLIRAIHNTLALELKGSITVATPEAIDYRRFFELVANSCGKRPKFINLPFGPVILMLRIARFLRISLPISDDNLIGLRQMQKVECADDLKKIRLTLKTAEESIAALQS